MVNQWFSIKNGDLPIKNGDLPIKHGDLPIIDIYLHWCVHQPNLIAPTPEITLTEAWPDGHGDPTGGVDWVDPTLRACLLRKMWKTYENIW